MTYSAIILAAGMSRRMGTPKMTLPWGGTTVLGKVAATLAAAHPALEIVVVTGGAREVVSVEVARLAQSLPVREIFNPAHEAGEMLASLQAGLAALPADAAAALIALGDQPQGKASTARELLSAFESRGARLLIPSYHQRRGHPWLVHRDLWPEILAMRAPQTMRNFLNAHAAEIVYIEAGPTVLQDIDTPEEYEKMQNAE
ncbi:nucleotidyltransferase family protein [bacterium]|nr:nucleotidyltransferase family protein [bacterium]OIO84319.1 MAG: hypothetical protein AUK01_09745 [Anaerolineae bacterium CG2_30_57_67]